MNHFKQWWATHITWVAAVVVFITPSVNAWVAAHPSSSAAVMAVWGIVLHAMPSSLSPKK